ncbi:hypothetical protein PHYSODRAFT_324390 [Phytophthora sojae]|uniref:Uncharacterized protein n=1 Tax=Phytophthora sojae (strain P6497) TaxID=1094619 RepID=G4YUY1_PHYSP|nr:hypothetical protein PHYSODRAFT_324390 [Phytophthora sojae]EGZ23147.1 hypothetical protein PHYSODRAFT_324390 [Phytophthora sojae]|eukprot:XP_009518435.1 hypothetical protein PHYSODRAFT_324390 [Phytophthora sojae]
MADNAPDAHLRELRRQPQPGSKPSQAGLQSVGQDNIQGNGPIQRSDRWMKACRRERGRRRAAQAAGSAGIGAVATPRTLWWLVRMADNAPDAHLREPRRQPQPGSKPSQAGLQSVGQDNIQGNGPIQRSDRWMKACRRERGRRRAAQAAGSAGIGAVATPRTLWWLVRMADNAPDAHLREPRRQPQPGSKPSQAGLQSVGQDNIQGNGPIQRSDRWMKACRRERGRRRAAQAAGSAGIGAVATPRTLWWLVRMADNAPDAHLREPRRQPQPGSKPSQAGLQSVGQDNIQGNGPIQRSDRWMKACRRERGRRRAAQAAGSAGIGAVATPRTLWWLVRMADNAPDAHLREPRRQPQPGSKPSQAGLQSVGQDNIQGNGPIQRSDRWMKACRRERGRRRAAQAAGSAGIGAVATPRTLWWLVRMADNAPDAHLREPRRQPQPGSKPSQAGLQSVGQDNIQGNGPIQRSDRWMKACRRERGRRRAAQAAGSAGIGAVATPRTLWWLVRTADNAPDAHLREPRRQPQPGSKPSQAGLQSVGQDNIQGNGPIQRSDRWMKACRRERGRRRAAQAAGSAGIGAVATPRTLWWLVRTADNAPDAHLREPRRQPQPGSKPSQAGLQSVGQDNIQGNGPIQRSDRWMKACRRERGRRRAAQAAGSAGIGAVATPRTLWWLVRMTDNAPDAHLREPRRQPQPGSKPSQAGLQSVGQDNIQGNGPIQRSDRWMKACRRERGRRRAAQAAGSAGIGAVACVEAKGAKKISEEGIEPSISSV